MANNTIAMKRNQREVSYILFLFRMWTREITSSRASTVVMIKHPYCVKYRVCISYSYLGVSFAILLQRYTKIPYLRNNSGIKRKNKSKKWKIMPIRIKWNHTYFFLFILFSDDVKEM